MTFVKPPGEDATQVDGEDALEGLGEARVEGAVGKVAKAAGIGKAAVEAAAGARAVAEGGVQAAAGMVVGAATEKATKAIGDKIGGIAGGSIPGAGGGVATAMRSGGIVAGLGPGAIDEQGLPVFEEKAITSFTGGKAVSSLQGKGSAAWGDGIASHSRAAASKLGASSGGSGVDFTFAWESAAGPEGPWSHLRVVAFRGTEALSSLYRYEITTLAREPAPEIDPDELIEKRATLRIATLIEPEFRVVHGIVVEAEELGPVPGGMLYRIVLAPPLARAMHRTRCRIFLEKTTRQIIDTVLQGDPELRRADGVVAPPDGGDDMSFAPAKEVFTWRITDGSRIDDVATRSYCVQYNESDFNFLCRLLEEEGISYHFENGDGMCLLVLSDKDAGRSRLEPFSPLAPGLAGRSVMSMKLGARLRPRKVSLIDYNWKQPALDMTVAEPARPSGADLVDLEYPGRYTETPAMGKPLAAVKLDRLEVEASYAVGEGTCRALAAGTVFALEHAQPRYEGEYLVTKLEVRGEQQGVLPPNAAAGMPMSGVPYAATFECARRGKNGSVAESRFRPARLTQKPRVHGSQTAFVTAEPSAKGAEIHVGGPPGAEIGCVRVKFHWDLDTARQAKEPTSCWVRVNQVFAGVGEGAVFHPRVGVEVIVDFEEGDPDRPIIVGRVYNGKNRPPGGSPTVSTFKTMSSPASGAFNELTFDDTAGNEQIKMHTPFNWNSDAGNDRSEKVGKNSASTAGVDRNETTGSNRGAMTGGNNSEIVAGNESVTVGANQNVNVGSNQSTSIGANQTLKVGENQTESVTGNRDVKITANDSLKVTGTQSVKVTGAQTTQYSATHDLKVGSNQTIKVGGKQLIKATGPQNVKSAAKQKVDAPEQEIKAGGKQALKSSQLAVKASSEAKVETPTFQVTASGELQLLGGNVLIKGSEITIESGTINIKGGQITMNGSPIKLNGGGEVNVKAGIIKLN
jgi:type VI secretion system secreted protein VgrG